MSNAKGRVDAGFRRSTRFSSPLARLKKENSPLDVTNIPIFTQTFFLTGTKKDGNRQKNRVRFLSRQGLCRVLTGLFRRRRSACAAR